MILKVDIFFSLCVFSVYSDIYRTTENNEYKSLEENGVHFQNSESIYFKVKSCDGAFIDLVDDSSSTENNNPVYRVHFEKEQSTITENSSESILAKETWSGLDCNCYVSIWVSWNSETIEAGKGTVIGFDKFISSTAKIDVIDILIMSHTVAYWQFNFPKNSTSACTPDPTTMINTTTTTQGLDPTATSNNKTTTQGLDPTTTSNTKTTTQGLDPITASNTTTTTPELDPTTTSNTTTITQGLDPTTKQGLIPTTTNNTTTTTQGLDPTTTSNTTTTTQGLDPITKSNTTTTTQELDPTTTRNTTTTTQGLEPTTTSNTTTTTQGFDPTTTSNTTTTTQGLDPIATSNTTTTTQGLEPTTTSITETSTVGFDPTSISTIITTTTTSKTRQTIETTDLSSTKTLCICSCNNFTLDEDELITKIALLKSELSVDKKQTNKYRRSLISTPDDRPSSRYIGTFAIVVLVVIFSIVVLMDFQHYAPLYFSKKEIIIQD